MRYAFKSVVSLLFGGLIAWGIAALVGLFFPRAAFWVFIVIMAWWSWIGWEYTKRYQAAREEGREIDLS